MVAWETVNNTIFKQKLLEKITKLKILKGERKVKK